MKKSKFNEIFNQIILDSNKDLLNDLEIIKFEENLNKPAKFEFPYPILTFFSPSTNLKMEILIMSTKESKKLSINDVLKNNYLEIDWPWHIYDQNGEIALEWKAGNNSVSSTCIKKNKNTRLTFKTNKQNKFRSINEAIKILKLIFINWGPKILSRKNKNAIKDACIFGGK